MNDQAIDREQLLQELASLRRRVSELEATELKLRQAEQSLREKERDVIEGKQAEQALLTERQNLLNLLDAMPDGVHICDKEYNVQYANKALERDFGPVDGRKCYEYFHDATQPCPKCHLHKVLKGRTTRLEWYSAKTGKTYDLIDTTVKRFDGGLSKLEMFRDVTDRKHAEQALRESESKYKELVELLPLFVFELDIDGKFTFINRAGMEATGCSKSDLASGLDVAKVVVLEDRDRVAGNIQRALRGQDLESSEYMVLRKDGATLPVLTWAAPLKRGEHIVGLRGVSVDISERKQAEAELKRNKETLEAILNATDDLVALFDPEGRFLSANAAMARRCRTTANEMVGKTVFDFVPHDLAVWRKQRLDEAIMTRQSVRFVDENRGKVFHTSLTPVLSRDGSVDCVAAFVRDITEETKASKAIKDSEERLAQIINFLPDATFVIDREGKVVAWNRAIENMTGVRAEDVLGKGNHEYSLAFYTERRPTLIDLVSQWDIETEQRYLYVRREGDTLISETSPDSLKLGRHLWNMACPLYDGSGQIIGAIESIRDITEKKMAQKAILRAERIGAVADLAFGVAHNFNNLLQIVIGNLELALIDMETGRYSDARESLEKVLQSSKSGATTVRRLQTFASVREESGTLGTEIFDLSEVALHGIEMTKPLWKTGPEKEGIDIKMIHRLEPGCLVKGTESELLEVIFNLIKNAAEAIPDKGEIVIEVSREGDRVAFRAQDTGIGIREADIGKVFEPFWTTKGVSIGTGMGLAVSHGIVQRHRGEISVRSQEGKGSVFTVMLPLAAKGSDVNNRERGQDVNVSLRILVIDDMPAIVQFMKRALTRIGHTTIGCTSGREALGLLMEQEIDLVICDLAMPEMNGWEVGKEIKRLHEERRIPKPPFVLLTGWGGQSLDKGRIADSGVDEVMEKPIDMKRLQGLLADAMGARLRSA